MVQGFSSVLRRQGVDLSRVFVLHDEVRVPAVVGVDAGGRGRHPAGGALSNCIIIRMSTLYVFHEGAFLSSGIVTFWAGISHSFVLVFSMPLKMVVTACCKLALVTLIPYTLVLDSFMLEKMRLF